MPGTKSASATSAEAALADFSPDERARILAVQDTVERAAAEHELDPSLINAIIWVESRFEPDAQSPAGARGLMQLMPATAAYLAKRLGEQRPRANDPEFNVRAGSLYLAEMVDKFDDERDAVAAYHAGPGNVAKWRAAGKTFPEWSNEYVDKVMAARERFSALPSGSARLALAATPSTEPMSEPSASVDDEPTEAPDPETLPDADELRRLAAAGLLDDEGNRIAAAEPTPEPEPTPTPEPEPAPIEEETFALVFEPHPEVDANPHAGPPPGWPSRSTPRVEPKPSPAKAPAKPAAKPVVAERSPPPSHDEQPIGLGVLPDL